MKNVIRVAAFLAGSALTLFIMGVVLKMMWLVFSFGWDSL